MHHPSAVHFHTQHDDDATRIAAILEALGYMVIRDPEPGTPTTNRFAWQIDRTARRYKLTERERDILALIVKDGERSSGIAQKLEISGATVKWHMHNIFAKTSQPDREGLLRLVLQIQNPESAGCPVPHDDDDDDGSEVENHACDRCEGSGIDQSPDPELPDDNYACPFCDGSGAQ